MAAVLECQGPLQFDHLRWIEELEENRLGKPSLQYFMSGLTCDCSAYARISGNEVSYAHKAPLGSSLHYLLCNIRPGGHRR